MERGVAEMLRVARGYVRLAASPVLTVVVEDGREPTWCPSIAAYVRAVRLGTTGGVELVAQAILAALDAHKTVHGGGGTFLAFVALNVTAAVFRLVRVGGGAAEGRLPQAGAASGANAFLHSIVDALEEVAATLATATLPAPRTAAATPRGGPSSSVRGSVPVFSFAQALQCPNIRKAAHFTATGACLVEGTSCPALALPFPSENSNQTDSAVGFLKSLRLASADDGPGGPSNRMALLAAQALVAALTDRNEKDGKGTSFWTPWAACALLQRRSSIADVLARVTRRLDVLRLCRGAADRSCVTRGVALVARTSGDDVPQCILPSAPAWNTFLFRDALPSAAGASVRLRLIFLTAWTAGRRLGCVEASWEKECCSPGVNDRSDAVADVTPILWIVVVQSSLERWHHRYATGLSCPTVRRCSHSGLPLFGVFVAGNVGQNALWRLALRFGAAPHADAPDAPALLTRGAAHVAAVAAVDGTTDGIEVDGASAVPPPWWDEPGLGGSTGPEWIVAATEATFSVSLLRCGVGHDATFATAAQGRVVELVLVIDHAHGTGRGDAERSTGVTDGQGNAGSTGDDDDGAPVFSVVICSPTDAALELLEHSFWQHVAFLLRSLHGAALDTPTLVPGAGWVEAQWAAMVSTPTLSKQDGNTNNSSGEPAVVIAKSLLASALKDYVTALHCSESNRYEAALDSWALGEPARDALVEESGATMGARRPRFNGAFTTLVPTPPLHNVEADRNETQDVLLADVAIWETVGERVGGLRAAVGLVRQFLLTRLVCFDTERDTGVRLV